MMATDERGDVLETYVAPNHHTYRVRVVWDEETPDWLADELGTTDPEDVWGYVVEELVVWQRVDRPEVQQETWEHVDSLWGIYGHEYAAQLAREALQVAGEPAG